MGRIEKTVFIGYRFENICDDPRFKELVGE